MASSGTGTKWPFMDSFGTGFEEIKFCYLAYKLYKNSHEIGQESATKATNKNRIRQ